MSANKCVGWWQQAGFGRQSMHNLELYIADQQLSGSGTDIIAAFTLQGRLRPDGYVEIIKQYERRHWVLYVGQYDGEGTLYGTWEVGGSQGEWSIKILGPAEHRSLEIQEIEPVH